MDMVGLYFYLNAEIVTSFVLSVGINVQIDNFPIDFITELLNNDTKRVVLTGLYDYNEVIVMVEFIFRFFLWWDAGLLNSRSSVAARVHTSSAASREPRVYHICPTPPPSAPTSRPGKRPS